MRAAVLYGLAAALVATLAVWAVLALGGGAALLTP